MISCSRKVENLKAQGSKSGNAYRMRRRSFCFVLWASTPTGTGRMELAYAIYVEYLEIEIQMNK